MPTLLSLPAELIEETALYVACSTLEGPSEFLFAINNVFLYSNAIHRSIFKRRRKFSHSAVAKTIVRAHVERIFASCFNCTTTVCSFIEERRGLDGKEPKRSLWVLTFMCLDDDGANTLQLNTVGAYEWIHELVTKRLHDGASDNGGWPLDNCRNSLALWVFWSLSTKERILSEPEDVSDRIVNLILPFVTIPFRYPMAFAPPNHFTLPLVSQSADFSNANTSARIPFRTRQTHLLSVLTPHGPFPIYRSTDPIWLQVYFTRRIERRKLLYFARRERYALGMMPTLPRDRADAIQRGMTGATQADIIEINRNRLGGPNGKDGGTKLPDSVTNVGPDGIDERSQASRLYDADWYRLRLCGNVWANSHGDDDEIWRRGNGTRRLKFRRGDVYTLGSLTGLWAGRMLIPNEQALAQLLMVQNPNPQQHNGHPVPLPAGFDEMLLSLTNRPIYMRLQEFVSYAGGDIVPSGARGPQPLSFYEDAEGDEEEEEEEDMDDSPVPEITDQRLLEEFDQGLQNAYFPDGVTEESFKGTYDGTGMRMICGGKEYVYHKLGGTQHDPDSCVGCAMREKQAMPAWSEEEHPADMVPLPPCTGVQDVIVTGSTDDRHGQAWNPLCVLRSRATMGWDDWDSEVVLLWIYCGWEELCGNWRITHEDPGMPTVTEE
ncbi:uncharacterized protein EV420DRAFT_1553247 [Desarmillaria tabescens]|uniref:F-box domain-containing protein n=1 Tax=Armillaria tabescens TaxID=1929756 RepID=A0AA39K9M1_ARMTA|nr:uncharacterized protein EV420DRAFT_1553247 [Desarmillaria tabescens]KAK0455784.1 hypothetical protein EV420DRAFT_1553247 [Desarmillaria tabescens]